MIDKAIKRASSKDFVGCKEFVLEFRGPSRVGLIVEGLAPTLGMLGSDVGQIMRKAGCGRETGVLQMFDRLGLVTARGDDGVDLDQAEELAIECEANEVEEAGTDEDDKRVFVFLCEPQTLFQVRGALEKTGKVEVMSAETRYEPRVMAEVPGGAKRAMEELVERLKNECSSVVAVYHNCLVVKKR